MAGRLKACSKLWAGIMPEDQAWKTYTRLMARFFRLNFLRLSFHGKQNQKKILNGICGSFRRMELKSAMEAATDPNGGPIQLPGEGSDRFLPVNRFQLQ
jgi:hypothetical protein